MSGSKHIIMSKRKSFPRHVKVPIDYRPIGQDRIGDITIREHQSDTNEFTRQWHQAEADGLVAVTSDGKLLGTHVSGFGDNYDLDDPVTLRTKSESRMCGGGSQPILMGRSATMLDFGQQQFTNIPGVGTEGLGYARWGRGNALPLAMYQASASLPYTASALDFLDRTFFGLGAKPVYVIARSSGGTVTHEEVDYRDAEVYLHERVLQLMSKLEQLTSEDTREDGVITPSPSDDQSSRVVSLPGLSGLSPSGERGEGLYRPKLIKHLEGMLAVANADLEAYYASRAKIDNLIQSNNIPFFLKRWIYDTVRLGICFPLVGLSRDKAGDWKPQIASLEMRDACVMRLEQRDPARQFRINNVYWCEKWRDIPNGVFSDGDAVTFPCINPEHPLKDINDIVNSNKRTRVAERPYWLCYPCYTPTPTKDYYPQLPWWSIFPSQVYQYAATMIYDKATAKQNSTMWGKILFINTAYLAQIFAQAGEEGKTAEGQAKIRKSIYDSVENFLKRRDNNGKLLVMDSYPSADEKQMIDSVRIVDVPRNDDVKASASEIAEICSLVSFSLGVNMDLVGSRPWSTSSATGTAQRELHLLKNGQLSPDRVTFTDFFDHFVFPFNGIDPHFRMRLFYPTLTTLDNSKTGTVEQSDEL